MVKEWAKRKERADGTFSVGLWNFRKGRNRIKPLDGPASSTQITSDYPNLLLNPCCSQFSVIMKRRRMQFHWLCDGSSDRHVTALRLMRKFGWRIPSRSDSRLLELVRAEYEIEKTDAERCDKNLVDEPNDDYEKAIVGIGERYRPMLRLVVLVGHQCHPNNGADDDAYQREALKMIGLSRNCRISNSVGIKTLPSLTCLPVSRAFQGWVTTEIRAAN